MNGIEYFFWLSWQAASGLLFAWPLSLALLLFVIAASVHAIYKRSVTRRSIGWLLLPAIVPIGILFWGAAFENAGIGPTLAIYPLFFSQFVVADFAIRRAINARVLAFAISAFVSHYSFWAAFVAGMSVTDDWF